MVMSVIMTVAMTMMMIISAMLLLCHILIAKLMKRVLKNVLCSLGRIIFDRYSLMVKAHIKILHSLDTAEIVNDLFYAVFAVKRNIVCHFLKFNFLLFSLLLSSIG